MRNRERGEGKLGLFIFLAIIAAGIFFLVKWIPPRVNAYEFRDYIGRWNTDPDMVMKRAEAETVRADLFREAQKLNLPVKMTDIKVAGTGGAYNIKVSFDITTDLKVWKKVDHYDFDTQAVSKD